MDTYLVNSTGKVGLLDEKPVEKFDLNGHFISYVETNDKDSIKAKCKFEHNAKGIMTSMDTAGNNREKKTAITVDYDSFGKYDLPKSFDSIGKMDVCYSNIITNK